MPEAYDNRVGSADITDGSILSEDLSQSIQENLTSLVLKQGHIAEHQFSRAYCTISAENVTSSIADLGSANAWAQVTAFDQHLVPHKHTIPSIADSHITVSNDGIYVVSFTMSFTVAGGSANQTYKASAFTNNGATEFGHIHGHKKANAASDVVGMTGYGIIRLCPCDTLELWVACTTAANANITILDVALSISRIA